MEKIVYFLCMMLIFTPGNAQNVNEITGSKVSVKDAREALDFHNQARKEVHVPPLEWSVELAIYAQEWAEYLANKNNCQIAHRRSLGKETKKVGENIFWGIGMKGSALYASKSWYGEIGKYNHSLSTIHGFGSAGHYTQMVWSTSRKVGFGIATCINGATIVVANYDPPGNYLGTKPY